jgi:cytochrome b subunit of formate dehydrogenase
MENIQTAKMVERYCALAIGIIFLILGLAGFTPTVVSLAGTSQSFIPLDESPNTYAAGFGYIFGLFPTNFLHNLVRCTVGLLGIASYTSASSARLFKRAFAVAYLVLAIMGLLPFAKTFFGLMPLFGNNVWVNALSAIAAAYYGIVIPSKVMRVNVSENL